MTATSLKVATKASLIVATSQRARGFARVLPMVATSQKEKTYATKATSAAKTVAAREGLNTGVARHNNDTGGDPDTYDTQHEAEGHDGNGSTQNEAEGHDGNGTQNDTDHERSTPLNWNHWRFRPRGSVR
jgi:ABC-type Zn2+ transport system substrate-binding protein/surface adhesin